MTPRLQRRFNDLKRELSTAQSSIKLLQADNARKTDELAKLKHLFRAAATIMKIIP